MKMRDGTGYDSSGFQAVFGMVITEVGRALDAKQMLQNQLAPLDKDGFNRAIDQLFKQVGDAPEDEALRAYLRRMIYDVALARRLCPICRVTELKRIELFGKSEMLGCASCKDEFIVPRINTASVP